MIFPFTAGIFIFHRTADDFAAQSWVFAVHWSVWPRSGHITYRTHIMARTISAAHFTKICLAQHKQTYNNIGRLQTKKYGIPKMSALHADIHLLFDARRINSALTHYFSVRIPTHKKPIPRLGSNYHTSPNTHWLNYGSHINKVGQQSTFVISFFLSPLLLVFLYWMWDILLPCRNTKEHFAKSTRQIELKVSHKIHKKVIYMHNSFDINIRLN